MIIAIDFDGTITDDTPYPDTGKIREEALEYIPKLHDLGHILILWTSRSDAGILDAKRTLERADLLKYFWGVNTNYEFFYGDSRKIYADVYFDDKALLGPVDWHSFYAYVEENS